MVGSAKVVEGALKQLSPNDRIDLGGETEKQWVGTLQQNLNAKAIRMTSILEVSYRSKDPQVAVNVVQAVVQSYLDFMDRMHKGTAGEISQMLTRERQELAEKLAKKQQELLDCRRDFDDMGFRSDGKALHPMVQRAVYFNDALIAAQKERVANEALLATIQTAILNGEDLGQYVMSIGDSVGRALLLNSLGLSQQDMNAQVGLEQNLISARAELEMAQQNLGPSHPTVTVLSEKIRLIERYLVSSRERMVEKMSQAQKGQLGPWLVQIVQQKLKQSQKNEKSLQAKFEETRAEAINLSGQLAQIEMLERDVKRLSDMNDVLLNQIASLDLKQNGQDVRVAVIEEPTVATSPISPKLYLVIFFALSSGFGVSLGVVTLLDALDGRFRSVDEMQGRLGLPLLSIVQQLQVTEKSGLHALTTHVQPKSTASESFRTLRTALTLTYPDARQIIVTSTEPGDGKTTVLANLAVCYAQAEKRTLLIDADLRRPGLTALMEMRGPLGLSEVLRSEGEIGSIAGRHIRPSGIKGLDVLPSGPRPNDPAELLAGLRMSQLLAWAESVYDLILIDSPPTLTMTDTAIVGRLVDGVIVVVQPAKNHRRLVTRVTERLNFMKIPILGLVVNRVGAEDGYYGYHNYGFGYGYGYAYEYGGHAGYGNEEDAASEDRESVAMDEDVGNEDEEPRVMVIPRRAA
jgi:capsular exopolysaccharide synthesis family protein